MRIVTYTQAPEKRHSCVSPGYGRYAVVVSAAILAGGVTLLVRQTAGIGFSAAAAALLIYYHFGFPWKRELPRGIPNIVLPIVLFVLSLAAAILGWFPAVGHYPHLAGALVGLLFLSLFRAHHRPLDDENELAPSAGRD